jgi:hypothetical protein
MIMATKTITVELSEELAALFEPEEDLSAKARELLVLDLLRDARISQGKAAMLLGITRWDILQLMGRHHIVSGPLTAEEARRDIETALRFAQPQPADVSGQGQ